MSELLARISDLEAMLALCGFILILVGLAIAGLPVARCDQCAHCRAEAINPRCPMCFQRHDPKERCR